MTVELGQWRLFVTVTDCGSLMKAAEVLRTDQPALSRSLRRLERLVGAPLFLRSSKGLALTELGERLLQPARRLLEQAAALESQALAGARTTQGLLRVGALDFFPLTTAIAEACQNLATRNPAVRTELVGLPWLSHAKAVGDRLIDVGFTLTVDGQLPAASIRCEALWDEPEAFALVSAHHPHAQDARIDPIALADSPLHLPDKDDNPAIYDLVLELLADAGVPSPRRAPAAGSLAAVIQQIAAGHGWSLISGTLARHTLPGTVAVPLGVVSRHRVEFALVWHNSADPIAVSALSHSLRSGLCSTRSELLR